MSWWLMGTDHLRPTLDQIMLKHGSDKASAASCDWQWPQDYCRRVYEPLLAPIRDEPISLLELGWGEWDPVRKDHANPQLGGRSARGWREYFTHPEAVIAAVDVEHKDNTAPGVILFRGSQDDPEFLRKVHTVCGPFDVIIDDASHVSSKTVAAFKALWPYLVPGGLYCVEDLHSSYHDYYFGENEACRNPGLPHARTAMGFFKRLADEAFFTGQRLKGPAVDGDPRSWDCYPRKYWLGYAVESITFHAPQMITIRKRGLQHTPPIRRP